MDLLSEGLGTIDQSGSVTPIAIQGPVISFFPTKTIPVIQLPNDTISGLGPTLTDPGSQTISPILTSGAIVSLQDTSYTAGTTVDPTTQQPATTVANPLSTPAATAPAGQSFGVIGWAFLAFGAYWLFK